MSSATLNETQPLRQPLGKRKTLPENLQIVSGAVLLNPIALAQAPLADSHAHSPHRGCFCQCNRPFWTPYALLPACQFQADLLPTVSAAASPVGRAVLAATRTVCPRPYGRLAERTQRCR